MKYKHLAFSLCALLAACSSQPLAYNRQIFSINPNVKLHYIEHKDAVRDSDGEMFVQVSGQPVSNQTVFYKIEWYDKRGMEISTTLSKWKQVKLTKGLDFNWKMISPSRRVVSYKVYITDDIGNGIIE